MPKFFLACFLIFSQTSLAQYVRQTVSSQGGNYFDSELGYVTQSVGQLSVVGKGTFHGFSAVQGFQQPSFAKIISPASDREVNLNAYPNPFTNQISVFNNWEEPITLTVFDPAGKLIFEHTLSDQFTEEVVNLNELSVGLYFFYFKSKSYQTLKKLIKQ